jgi:energy-coupling factor transport system ATP-binding protein
MTEIIRADKLSLRYPYANAPTLQNISFTLERGERVLLLGPSGSGKSSLSLCLNGLIPHTIEAELSGSLRLFGRESTQIEPTELARRIGIVFQDPESQFCTLTVEDEMAFGLENLCLPRLEIERRIQVGLAKVNLAAQRHTRLDRLSGGMKQRLVLAATLSMKPDLLVLDEATANLDPAGVAEAFDLITNLAQSDPDLTLVLIEHRLDPLMSLINRVLVIDENGCLIQDGPPRQIFAQHGLALDRAGVWQPAASRLAHHLQQAYIKLPIGNGPQAIWPLTLREVLEGLQQQPAAWSLAAEWTKPLAPVSVPPNPEVIVQFRHVHFYYPNGTRAVQELDFAVHRGEILALVGGNGAGKSTVAQLIAGLLRPQQGIVEVAGRDIRHASVRELARQCGFVFQNPEHQFVTDRVFDEVAFGLKQQSFSEVTADVTTGAATEATIHVRVEELLTRFGLNHKQQANPFELSQGQKRRLSVATMLVANQNLLILDEPTFGQDAGNLRELTDELLQLNQHGVTLVLVTHDMELVWNLAHRIAVMAEGRLLKVGLSHEIFSDSALMCQAKLKPPVQAVIATALQTDFAQLPALQAVKER